MDALALNASSLGLNLLWVLCGVFCAGIIALIPGLHIYNIAGLILVFIDRAFFSISPDRLAFLFLGMTTGYAVFNTVPSVFLSVPDETTIFVVLPAQKYLLQRRGHEAVVLTGLGALGGLTFLVIISPVAARIITPLRELLRLHLGWILVAIMVYLLMSEWPKGTGRPTAGWKRWWDGWQNLMAGIATFILSGILGIILMYRPLVPFTFSYQNLLPAFTGLFAIPWIIQNLLARVAIPPQYHARSVDAPLDTVFQGVFTGILGGMIAAFFPVITGGIGALLAGQATAQNDDRVFLISQGASKVVYYVGGLLLFFVPGLHLTRGGMAWMLNTQYKTFTPEAYYLATGAALVSGVVAFFLSLGLARLTSKIIALINYHVITVAALGVLLLVVMGFTGARGLLICAVATGIGLIPVLWGARRMNAMGILLLPITIHMAGKGEFILRLLGII